MNNAFRVPLRAQGGMPEYRSQSIGPQAGANVSARLTDTAGRMMIGQAVRNAATDARDIERFNTGLQGFLKAGVGLYNDYRDKTSRAYIQEAVLRSQEEFAAWQADYDKTHQGEQGINAAADYEQAWARISQTHMKGLRDKGVSGPYEQYADLQFRQNGLHYGRQGVAFQTQQDRRWKGSLADGAYAALENTVAANPDDHERIGAMKAQAYQAYALAHPGEDMRAFEDKVNNLVANTSIEARIAAGDFEGAQRDLAVYGNAGGVNNGHSIAEDHNNPLNEKAPGKNTGTREDFKVYASIEDGLRGNWGLLQRYQSRHNRRTLREIITRWAPPSENRTAQYIANVSQKAGIDADAPVNMRDIPTAARVIKAMAEQESPLGQRLTVPQIEAALKGENAKRPAMYVAYDNPEGLTEQGNIDIANRPQVRTPDGGTATVRSMSVNFDGAEVLLPTVSQDGRLLSEDEAIAEYRKTGKHLGKFDTPEHATAYAQKLHEQQEKMYLGPAARQQPGRAGAGWLTPKQQAAYQGQLDHIRRQQAQEAGLTAQAFGNHLEYGLDKGDFTAAEKDVEGLRSLGFTKEAAELADRLELSRTAYAALTDAGDLPLVEQGAAAKKRLDGLVTPDNAKAATAMRDSVDKALAAKQAAFVKDPAAYVAALPAMQGEMSLQERVSRSLVMQSRMGKGLPYAPRILGVEQAKLRKRDYDKLDSPATRVQWLQQVAGEYGPYAHLALEEMKVPSQVVSLLPALGRMNEKGMGLALTALEVKDSDIPGLTTDARLAAQNAAANNPHMQRIREFVNAFPANDGLRQFGKGWETMLTNYVKLGGNLEDFDQAFESSTAKGCFLLLPRNAEYSVDDVADATDDVRESLRAQLLADVKADTEQGRIARANLTGLIRRGLFVSDETGTKVTLIDPQHGRPVKYADGTLMQFDIKAIVRERRERNQRLRLVEATDSDAMQVTED